MELIAIQIPMMYVEAAFGKVRPPHFSKLLGCYELLRIKEAVAVLSVLFLGQFLAGNE